MEKDSESPRIDHWLSEHGKGLYFPALGITKQANAAKDTSINATAGVAYNDDGSLITLKSLVDAFKNLDPSSFNYAPTPGIQELREEWIQKIHRDNPSLGNAPTTLPIVTNGLTHGINIACQLFLDSKEDTILTDKYWDNYELMVKMGLHGNLKTYSSFSNEGYNIQALQKLSLAEGIGKKFFIFNVPNNPTGYSPTHREQDEIVNIMIQSAEAGNKVITLCDDAYFGLAYSKDVAPESLFAKLANAHENITAIKIDGATKEYCAWGLRVGFITIGGKSLSQEEISLLENKISGAIRSNASNGSRPAQEALLQMLQNPEHKKEKQAIKDTLQERFEECNRVLIENKDTFSECFKLLPSNSGYFICLELQQKITGEKVRQTLLNQHDIGIIAIEDWLRVAFSAVGKEKIPHLLKTLYKVCSEQL